MSLQRLRAEIHCRADIIWVGPTSLDAGITSSAACTLCFFSAQICHYYSCPHYRCFCGTHPVFGIPAPWFLRSRRPLGASPSFDTERNDRREKQGVDVSKPRYRIHSGSRKILKSLVGAGRFERPTPCAQVIGVTYSGLLIVTHKCCGYRVMRL